MLIWMKKFGGDHGVGRVWVVLTSGTEIECTSLYIIGSDGDAEVSTLSKPWVGYRKINKV